MIVVTRLDLKSYTKLIYTLTYRRPIIILLTVIGIALIIDYSLLIIAFKMPFKSVFIQLLFGFLFVLYPPLSVYLSAKKSFSSHRRLHEKIVYEFTVDRILIKGDTFSSESDWSKIYKIIELNKWILIYQNRMIANILPKESFGELIVEFRNLVKSKNIKARLKQ